MKPKTIILFCLAIGYVLFSCSTQPVAQPSYLGDLSEEELREMQERNRTAARAYLQELEESHPDSIQMLNFDWDALDTCFDFSKYNKVWSVVYSGIKTDKVDKALFSSDSLEVVTLNRCSFRKIEFPTDNHIERLNLSNCNLTRIPRSIRCCKHLKELNLENNQLRHIPRWIMDLDSLEELTLNFNPLRLNRADIRHLSKVKKLIICGNGIERLPSNIGRLQCESLNLAKNQLHTLPPSFADLKQLKSLIFYENAFEEIPVALADLKELKHLDFYKNRLKQIPDFVGDMEEINQLFLSYNSIGEIPDTLRNLKQLRYFYIHHNELHFLPEWITEMDSIERLGVGYNHLLELPDLSKMKSLKDFDCEHNLLERFPWELAEKPDMELLILRDNDFILSDQDRMKLIQLQKNMNIVY